MSELVC